MKPFDLFTTQIKFVVPFSLVLVEKKNKTNKGIVLLLLGRGRIQSISSRFHHLVSCSIIKMIVWRINDGRHHRRQVKKPINFQSRMIDDDNFILVDVHAIAFSSYRLIVEKSLSKICISFSSRRSAHFIVFILI